MMWIKFRQALCWLLQGRDEMECMFTVLTSRPNETICDGGKRMEKKTKVLICSVCGNEIIPDIDKHYISIEAGQTGISTAFKKDEEEIFDTFDCERCGCQHIAQPRNRVYIGLNTEDFMRITNETQEENIED